jgi:hypothetical protein
VSEELVERVARAIARELLRQDGSAPDGHDGLNADLTIDYLDQGRTDFAAVARAAIAAMQSDPIPVYKTRDATDEFVKP